MSASINQESRAWVFGPFRFDAITGELRRNGTIVPLRPKATDILAALIEADGQLVSHRELIQRAWPDTVLEEEVALHTAIKQIRRALGDSASAPTYIETVHRRGYRFSGPLTAAGAEDVRGERRRAKGLPVAVGVVAVAVGWVTLTPQGSVLDKDLPAADRASYLLSRGSDADVWEAIALLEPLTVAGTTSPRVWSSLGAAYNRQQRFDEAEQMARHSLELNDESGEAYRVLAESAMMHRQDFQAAERLFLRALTLEPNDAESHGGYAFLLLLTGAIDESIREMRRALSLEPLSTLINGDAALMLYWAGRLDEAEEQARRTLEIEPQYVPALECLRLVGLARGDNDGARDASVKVLQALGQPDSLVVRIASGPPADALEAFLHWRLARTESRLSDEAANAWLWHGLALAEAGRIAEARAALTRARELRASMLPLVYLDARSKAVAPLF